jgi:hypothetical protein
MRRSVGVTISAVIVLVGSGLTLLYAAFVALASLALTTFQRDQQFLGVFAAVGFLFLVGFGAWGIATGVGLIQLREWARISILIFSALLVFGTLMSAVVTALLPFGSFAPQQSGDDFTQFLFVMRVVLMSAYGSVMLLGIWWLYFFMKAATREQFAARRAAPAPAFAAAGTYASPVAAHDAGLAYAEPPMRRLGRPVSITVIAALFLIGACMAPISFLQMSVMFPGVGVPFMLFGTILTGTPALIGLSIFLALRGIAGVGLLKLQPWARTTAICLEAFGLVNTILSFGLPSGRAAFSRWMTAIMDANFRRLHLSDRARLPPGFPYISEFTVIGAIFAVPVSVAILWFLVKEKDAFYRPKRAPLSPG